MTSDSATPEAVHAVRRELENAHVHYEDVFVRREEIVVVLPGRGQERAAAASAAAKVPLSGRYYVSIMARDGAPHALRIVLLVLTLIVGVFGSVLLIWGFLGGRGAESESAETAAPEQPPAR